MFFCAGPNGKITLKAVRGRIQMVAYETGDQRAFLESLLLAIRFETIKLLCHENDRNLVIFPVHDVRTGIVPQ
jgi:hypothetical protein